MEDTPPGSSVVSPTLAGACAHHSLYAWCRERVVCAHSRAAVLARTLCVQQLWCQSADQDSASHITNLTQGHGAQRDSKVCCKLSWLSSRPRRLPSSGCR